MPGRQAADHEQAHPPGHRDVDHRRVIQPPVGMRHLLIRDPHPVIGDIKQHAAAGQRLAGHVDLGILRRERRRVLHDLRDQVHDIVDSLPDHDNPGLHIQDDPLILLNLRDRRPEHIDQGDRLTPPPGHLMTRQNQQVLGITAHPGSQVIQPEQAAEPPRILLALLQRVDQRQLPLDQRLAAPGQVDEHRVQVAAQHGLISRQPDRLTVNLVKSPRDLTDLVRRGNPDRLDVNTLIRALTLAQPPHHLRQPVTSHIQRIAAQLTQRADQRPRHERGNQQHQQQQDQSHQARDQQGLGGLGPQRVDPGGNGTGQLVGDLARVTDGGRHIRVPGRGIQGVMRGQRRVRVGGQHRLGQVFLGASEVDPHTADGVAENLPLRGARGGVEVGLSGRPLLEGLVEGGQVAGSHRPRRRAEHRVQDRALHRRLVLDPQQRAERDDVALQLGIVRADTGRAAERVRGNDDVLGVSLDDLEFRHLRRRDHMAEIAEVQEAVGQRGEILHGRRLIPGGGVHSARERADGVDVGRRGLLRSR